MKLKHLFTLNLFIAIFFGVTCVFFSSWVLSLYGMPAESGVIWAGRLAGGSILGFASLLIQFGGHPQQFWLVDLLVYGLLTLGYAWFLFIKPDYI